jgi:hypothetical protein
MKALYDVFYHVSKHDKTVIAALGGHLWGNLEAGSVFGQSPNM